MQATQRVARGGWCCFPCAVLVAALWGAVLTARAAAIYVDAANAGPQDGLTPETAWSTLSGGLAHLAAANAIVKGGHTLSIAAGVYTPAIPDVSSSHSGLDGAPNRLAGSGASADAVVLGVALKLTGAQFMVIGNLTVSNAVSLASAAHNNVVTNCRVRNSAGPGVSIGAAVTNTLITHSVIFDNASHGINLDNALATRGTRVNHCTIFGNGGSGMRLGQATPTVRNSIIAGNLGFGLEEADPTALYRFTATTNVLFGNGAGQYNQRLTTGYFSYSTEAELDLLPGCTNNMVRDPGFAALADNWDFGAFYTDSPCLDAADDGTALGAFPYPSLVPVSANTYYVAPDGDDTRSPATVTDPDTPWASISNAAMHAVAGDTVIVAAGTYTGGVRIARGGSQIPVIYRTLEGATVVNTGAQGFYLDRVSGVVIDGFTITRCANGVYASYAMCCAMTNGSVRGNTATGASLNRSPRLTFSDMSIYSNTTYGVACTASTGMGISGCRIWRNSVGISPNSYATVALSVIYDNTSHGMDTPSSHTGILVDHCSVCGNRGSGVRAFVGAQRVRNSVIAGNAGPGLEESHESASFILTNNVVFANGSVIYDNGTSQYRIRWTSSVSSNYASAAEINALPQCSGTVVGNPGFAALADNWDFGAFYTDSPCLNAANDGTAIGAIPYPALVPVSANTYYVAPGGDDTRSAAAAANPATPWASISNAAMHAVAGDTVRVAAGTYTGGVVIARGGSQIPVIYRTLEGATVVNTGAYGFHLDRVSNVVLDGFTVTGCATGLYATFTMDCRLANGASCGNSAMGVVFGRTQSVAIEGMSICSNGTGGVFFDNGSAGKTTVDRCRIFEHYRNGSSFGIGSYDISSKLPIRITNSDIFRNYAGVSATYSLTRLENCVIYGNRDGIALNVSLVVVPVVNCILSGNVRGLAENNTTPEFACTNCCFFANSTAHYYDNDSKANLTTVAQINALTDVACANNIESDPGYRNAAAGDFRIARTSPCHDAGTTATDLTLDLYGGRRRVGPAVDVGSYEVPPPQGTFVIIR